LIAESLGYFDAAEYERQVEHGAEQVTNGVFRAAFPRRDAQTVDPHSMKERWCFTNHSRQPVNDRTNYFGG